MLLLSASKFGSTWGHGVIRLCASLLLEPCPSISQPCCSHEASTSGACGEPRRGIHSSSSCRADEEDAFYGSSAPQRPRGGGKQWQRGVKSILGTKTVTPAAVPTPWARPNSSPRSPTSPRPPPRPASQSGVPPTTPGASPTGTSSPTAEAQTQRSSASRGGKDGKASSFSQLSGLPAPTVPPPRSVVPLEERQAAAVAAPVEMAPAKDPLEEHIDSRFGFAIVGGIDPTLGTSTADGGAATDLTSVLSLEQGLDLVGQHPRLHPRTTFMPGQAYDPEDLNVYARATTSKPAPKQRGLHMPSLRNAKMFTDYKNVMFLEKFLTPAGRILPRTFTKLPRGMHKYVARQIKVARAMALMPHEARLGKVHLPRLRQAEARAAGQLQ